MKEIEKKQIKEEELEKVAGGKIKYPEFDLNVETVERGHVQLERVTHRVVDDEVQRVVDIERNIPKI